MNRKGDDRFASSIGEPHGHNVRDDDVDRGQVATIARSGRAMSSAGSWEVVTRRRLGPDSADYSSGSFLARVVVGWCQS